MTILFIGLGPAGAAIRDALLDYRAVKRARPLVLTADPENGNRTVEALKTVKGIDFALLFSSLGGSDQTSRIAEFLTGLNIPCFLVGIVPAKRREKSEKLAAAYQSLEQLEKHVRTVLIVDNERIAHLPNYEDFYPGYNRYIASCIADLLAGIAAPGSASASESSSALQLSEMPKLLSFDDEPGYVALSRASELTKGLWGYIIPVLRHKPLDLRTLLRVSLEKFSVSDMPLGCEKCLSILQVPDYFLSSRSVDREQVEEVLQTHAKEYRLAVFPAKRNIASITNLFTFKFEQLERLREIRRLAHETV
ncbi:MAG TPA: hypothetical protein ENN68_03310 [Methanomicrobia archaeon]|nr:hypothetical protein [Methanomicrobia archaeon]